MFEFDSDYEGKKSLIKLMYKMANANDHLDEEEMAFIYEVAEMAGFSKAEVDLLIKEDLDNVFLPDNEFDRMNILYHLLFITRTDGAIHSEEQELCVKLGLQLGLRPEMVESLLELMIENLGKEVPPAEMRERILAFLN